MRIVQVLPSADRLYGGPVAIAEELCAGLRAESHEAVIRAGRPATYALQRFLGGYWLSPTDRINLRTAITWSDLVHVHGAWNIPATVAIRLAAHAGKGIVFTPHGMLRSWARNQGRLKKRVYFEFVERENLRCVHRIQFNNANEVEEACNLGITAKTAVIPNGVDWERWQDLPPRETLRARLPAVQGKVVGLFLSRIAHQKGLDLLLESLTREFCQRTNLYLVVAGTDGGRYEARCRRMVAERDLEDHVNWFGPAFDEDKRCLLGAADFFVLPSRGEGDSVAVKEALAAGIPVILSEACSLGEVVAEGAGIVTGYDQDLRASIEYVASNKGRRRQMGEAARRFAKTRLSARSATIQTIEMYEQVIREVGSAPQTETR